jgi:DcaP outer membrane protein
MGRTRVWLVVVLCLASSVSAQERSAEKSSVQNQPAQSQAPENQQVQQLQQKVQQLEQLTEELKSRLAEVEKQNSGKPQVVNATTTLSGDAPSTKSDPPSEARVDVASPSPNTNPRPQDAPPRPVPEESPSRPEMEIYGHAMLDLGYDFGQINPNWFDVERPTQLPAFHNEFGQNGRLFAGVRQTRFGVKSWVPTQYGELRTVFEFELFGVGAQAGETNFRLRHAYGELGQLLAGQTWSPFMDPDVFPNSIEYWGPNGMVFFRNVQLRWQPINNGNKQVYIALERPGASADLGLVQDRDILQGVQFRFPASAGAASEPMSKCLGSSAISRGTTTRPRPRPISPVIPTDGARR